MAQSGDITARNSRVVWVDTVKYICIMWVMLSHLDSNTDVLYQFYSPFFLCGFLFASGYVYRHKEGFRDFLIKKIKGLFIPWLVFSLLNILLSQILSFRKRASLLEELKWNFLQIRSIGDGVWFVAALFVAFIPFYFFIARYEKSDHGTGAKIKLLGSSLLLALASDLYLLYMDPNLLPWGTVRLPWHAEYVFVAVFWMVLGYLFKQEFETAYDHAVSDGIKWGSIAVFLLLRYSQFIFPNLFAGKISGLGFSCLSSLLGVFMLIFICKKIKPSRYMLYIGQNTLICFALHGKVFTIMQVALEKFAAKQYEAILSNPVASSVLAIVFTFILSLILMIPIYIINRWLPFLAGRWKKR